MILASPVAPASEKGPISLAKKPYATHRYQVNSSKTKSFKSAHKTVRLAKINSLARPVFLAGFSAMVPALSATMAAKCVLWAAFATSVSGGGPILTRKNANNVAKGSFSKQESASIVKRIVWSVQILLLV